MVGSFEDELVQMHDEELSLPSIQVALERHLALVGGDSAAERGRLAAHFKEKRNSTILSQEILQLLSGP